MTDEYDETRLLSSREIAARAVGPGTVLRERYRLEAELGRGGMGVVYRATDLELQREVAVKVLSTRLSDSAAHQRLQREARAAAALNHPHIVAVHDVGEDRGQHFFVMELVQGPDLGKSPPGDLGEIVAVALQICDALDHAHTTGIVHRDLKPENVLYAGDGDSHPIKLADLGLAAPVRDSDITTAGLIVGTPAYMAPEQVLGQRTDGRADLYALGVLLYKFSTGRLPFTGDDPLAIISQHVHAPPVPPRMLRSEITPALEAVILRLLAKDPERRYASAAETAKALSGTLDEPRAGDDAEIGGTVVLLDALARGRLVGRAEELKQTRELWQRALGGQGHCLLISGEPGAGKTRFAREILIQAALDGAAALTGAGYEYEATTPYLPFVEAFRGWLRQQEEDDALREQLGDTAPEIAKLAPELATRLGPFPERAELPPHEERLYFFDAMVRALRALAAERGLIFYIDDLHWADSSTLWLLGHLIRNLRDEPVLFVSSYREIELDRAHPLAKALVEWNRERLTTRLVLRRFGLEETRVQLGALLVEDISTELAEVVYRETEGNPFFVEEVVKALIEEGAIRRVRGHWEHCEIPDLVIPQSVKAAIGNRLDRVSDESNGVLRAAAVLGKTFDFAELSLTAGDQGEDALLDALDEAVSAQLLIAERGERFAFTHDKIREVLYEELNPIRRRRLHKRAAEKLQTAGGVAVETLAYHFIEAGDHEQGLRYAKDAAGEAARIFAFPEAIEAYGRGVECAEALGLVAEQLALEEAMGDTCFAGGEMIAARVHYEQALELADDPETRARLQCGAASSCVTTGDPKGLDYVREALTTLDAAAHPAETALALAIEARFHHHSGRQRRAIELLERAAVLLDPDAVSEPATDRNQHMLAEVYAYLSGAHQHLALFVDANRWARKGIDYGERFDVPLAMATGYEFLGENAIGQGDWEEGLEYAAEERRIVERLRSRERLAWTYLVEANCSLLLGDFARAEHALTEGLDLSAAIGEKRLHSLLSSCRVWLLAERGILDDAALTLAQACIEEADALGLYYMRAEARRCTAIVRFKRGEHDQALALIEENHALHEGKEACINLLWLGPLHVETLIAAGRTDEARERFKSFARLVAGCQAPHFDREVERLRGLVPSGRWP